MRLSSVILIIDKPFHIFKKPDFHSTPQELPHMHPYTLMTTSKSSYHSAIDIWMFDPLLDKWYDVMIICFFSVSKLLECCEQQFQ